MFDLPSRVNRSTMSTPDVGSKTGRFVQTLNDPKETGQRDKRVKRKNPVTVRIEITNVTPADRRAASTIVSLTSRGSVRTINRIGEYGKSSPCPMIVPIAISIVLELSVWCASRNSVLTQIIAIKALRYLILLYGAASRNSNMLGYVFRYSRQISAPAIKAAINVMDDPSDVPVIRTIDGTESHRNGAKYRPYDQKDHAHYLN